MEHIHSHPVIALLTDFGIGDGDVGVMKGVIAGITPGAHIIDITHEIAPQRIPSGAWILASAYRYFPTNTVFVCVVDPGVGSSRGAIALHAGEWFFVGPDNGLFSYVLAEQPVHAAVLLSNPEYHRQSVSATFHGRDIFAPVGAHLARGTTSTLHELGPALDPATLQRLEVGQPTRHGSTIEGRIIHVDNFGNLITSIPLSMVPDLFELPRVQLNFPSRQRVIDQRRRFFTDGPDDGQPFIYGDSSGYVGVAVRNGSAAKTLEVGYGTAITFVTFSK
ncbi:MAG TPA: SAM-dependent chlorinase/fluorinase [Ktedonobacteraceae bacterium]|nr:SAM-dependent chlorinase/fluorinase [Ktedonobacteraceae bacterium]